MECNVKRLGRTPQMEPQERDLRVSNVEDRYSLMLLRQLESTVCSGPRKIDPEKEKSIKLQTDLCAHGVFHEGALVVRQV